MLYSSCTIHLKSVTAASAFHLYFRLGIFDLDSFIVIAFWAGNPSDNGFFVFL